MIDTRASDRGPGLVLNTVFLELLKLERVALSESRPEPDRRELRRILTDADALRADHSRRRAAEEYLGRKLHPHYESRVLHRAKALLADLRALLDEGTSA